jgi:hypothetical protein
MSPHRLLRQRAATTRPAAHAGRPTVDVHITRLVEGGRAVVAQRVAHLTEIQLALVVALAVRTRDESMLDELVRGYAPSPWLIAVLPWETATPSAATCGSAAPDQASLAAGASATCSSHGRGFEHHRVILGRRAPAGDRRTVECSGNAMTLATVSLDGAPSVRNVLLKSSTTRLMFFCASMSVWRPEHRSGQRRFGSRRCSEKSSRRSPRALPQQG